jgi:hypothetical protein
VLLELLEEFKVVGEVKGADSELADPILLKKFAINELLDVDDLLIGGVVDDVGGVGLAVAVDGVVAALLALAVLEVAC